MVSGGCRLPLGKGAFLLQPMLKQVLPDNCGESSFDLGKVRIQGEVKRRSRIGANLKV